MDEPEHNLSRVVFQPITQTSTRVAALLSGEVDVAEPIPLQDIDRINENPGTKALTGPELRTIFLGMDQWRDELTYSNIKGKNPLQDQRVRQAMYQAIDIEAIHRVVMRGQFRRQPPCWRRVSSELESAIRMIRTPRALLEEAGYPDGFSLRMNCPNDRYVNDEAICEAVVVRWRVGIEVICYETRSLYFAKVLARGYDTDLSAGLDLQLRQPTSSTIGSTRDPERGRGTTNLRLFHQGWMND